MTLIQRYREQVAAGNFQQNNEQERVVAELQEVSHAVMSAEQQRNKLWQIGLRQLKLLKPQVVKGVYLWGPVGVGKTSLMDLFYESLPAHKKIRMHFYQFMQYVHQELKLLQGHSNPLELVAARFAKQTKVICLDEFLVTDIADAMLLANLLKALFGQGITLLTTANAPPDDLYRHGLQRQRFLPAIELIKKNLKIIQLDTKQDYRLRPQKKPFSNYFYPLDRIAVRQMEESFLYYQQLELVTPESFSSFDPATAPLQAKDSVEVMGRSIPTLGSARDVVWFDFHQLCAAPRSQLDYLEIARRFATVLISNVPQFNAQETNSISYFIKLVDVFYDARIHLILSAAVSVNDLYPLGDLTDEFKRTQSRLIEMCIGHL